MRIVTLLTIAVLSCGLAVATTPPQPPAPPSPTDTDPSTPAGLIRGLYEGYFEALTKSSADPYPAMPPEYEWEAIAERTFTPEFAARFKKALNAPEPVFDWDLFANGQDFGELKIISVTVAAQDNAKATVAITTSNFGVASTNTHFLVNGASGWKISDIEVWSGTPEAARVSAMMKDAGF